MSHFAVLAPALQPRAGVECAHRLSWLEPNSVEPRTPALPESSEEEDRLDSWKAIAAYLNRDVRTVQRWELREELPVHRHQHDKLASVYAYRSELRQWQASRRTTPDSELEGETTALDRAVASSALPNSGHAEAARVAENFSGSRSTSWRAPAVVGLVGMALAAYVWSVSRDARPTVSGRLAQLRLVQADVNTPDTLREMTPAIRQAIRQAWREAGGELLPELDVRTTLSLMRRSSEQLLSAEIAREVALRAGGVHYMLEPRVEAAADGYRLTLVAWAGPEARAEVAKVTTSGVGFRNVTREFALLTQRAINGLTQTTSSPTVGFPRVTTRTLAALHQFAEADRMMKRSLWEPALPLLREAIGTDPEFASAYVHLAWTLSNLSRPALEWRPLLDRGMQLREVAAEPERWFIAGSYYQLIGQRDDAVASYERVLTSDPDHYWALGNLAIIKDGQGQWEAGAQLRIRRARVHPDSLISQFAAADLSTALGDRVAARGFRRQVGVLLGNGSPSERWIPDLWLPLFDACEAWERRDVSAAAAAADAMRTRLMADGRASPHEYYRLGMLYLDLGMIRRAEETFAIPAQARERHQYLAWAAAARNDWPVVRERLLEFAKHFDRTEPATGPLLVEANLLPQADQLIARWDREKFWPENVLAPFRAALHIAHGRPLDARRALDAALPQLARPALTGVEKMPTGGLPLLSALRLEARLQREAGQLTQAAATLEKADVALGPVCTAYRSSGFLWMTLRAELAALYRQQGLVGRAVAVEADLTERLALADPDHAVLAAIRASAKR